MSKEAMKLALEALKQIDEAMPFPVAKLAQSALRKALASEAIEQPAQQEPVAPKCGAIIEVFGHDWRLDYMSLPVGKHKLYTQQYTYTAPQPAQQEPVAWVDAGNLKKLRNGDVIRVIRNGEVYYSPFRYCGVLEECDYEYYRENSQFVYLEVGMAMVEKIVYTTKDFTTGAVYADRGDRVEVAYAIEAKLKEKNT